MTAHQFYRWQSLRRKRERTQDEKAEFKTLCREAQKWEILGKEDEQWVLQGWTVDRSYRGAVAYSKPVDPKIVARMPKIDPDQRQTTWPRRYFPYLFKWFGI
jgi:hypothetical protein